MHVAFFLPDKRALLNMVPPYAIITGYQTVRGIFLKKLIDIIVMENRIINFNTASKKYSLSNS